jgi:hypothetical protein
MARSEGIQKLAETIADIFDGPSLLDKEHIYSRPEQTFRTLVTLKPEAEMTEENFALDMEGRSAPKAARIIRSFLNTSGLLAESSHPGPQKGMAISRRALAGIAVDASALDDYANALAKHLETHEEARRLLQQSVRTGNSIKEHMDGITLSTEYLFTPEDGALSVQFRIRTADENLAKKLKSVKGATSERIPGSEAWKDNDMRKQHGGEDITLTANDAQSVAALFDPRKVQGSWR